MVTSKSEILENFLENNRGKDSISSDIKGTYFDYPFPHILLENVLKQDTYNKVCEYAEIYLGQIKNEDYFGEKYGKIYSLQKEQIDTIGNHLCLLKEWRDFLGNIFDLEITKYVASTFHLHEGSEDSPSVLGWAHTDRDLCGFNDKNVDDKELFISNGHLYQDWTPQQMIDYNLTLQSRCIAYLYYFNNKIDWSENDGGGTAIYLDGSTDKLFKSIPPLNNSLFIFKITHNSYHGVLPAKFFRYANVGWLHSDANEYVNRNLEKWKENPFRFFQSPRIISNKYSPAFLIEKTSSYTKYFDKPLRFL